MPELRMPYKHKPFEAGESIRLIRILPREHAADTTCAIDLFNFSSGEAPVYAALSYTWGSPKEIRTISCNGAALSVGTNLFHALCHLNTRQDFLAVDPQYLWVDAICINQNDPHEKNQQISCMHNIYRNAQKVLIWLGEDQYLPSNHTKPPPLPDATVPRKDLVSYLFRSYWTRVWTLQEVILSQRKSILLDDIEIDWDHFWSDVTSGLAKLGHSIYQPQLQRGLQFFSLTSSMGALVLLLERPTLVKIDPTLSPLARDQFHRVTKFASRLDCCDPRDRIYSLIGLASAIGIQLPPPDYTKPVRAVFQEARDSLLEGLVKEKTKFEIIPSQSSRTFKPSVQYTAQQVSTPEAHLPLSIRTNPLQSPTTPLSFDSSSVAPQSLGSKVAVDHSDSESSTSDDSLRLDNSWNDVVRKLINDGKEKMLREVIHYFASSKSSTLPILCCGRGQNSSTGSTYTQESQGSGKSANRTNKKQKTEYGDAGAAGHHERPHDDEDGDDDDDLEDRRPRKRINRPSKENSNDRYACPYYQRNCQNPQLHGACRGPGFEDIHRLKEHLNRVHFIHLCDRCGEVFPTPELLTTHRLVPAQAICELSTWSEDFDRDRGFTEAQKVSMARIKRNNTTKPWNGIFKVLFPEDPESSYPPQFYSNMQFTQFAHEFEAYFAQQSQTLLPERLTNAPFLAQLGTQNVQEIRDDLVHFVNQISTDIVRSFRDHVLQGATGSQQPTTPRNSRSEFSSHSIPMGIPTPITQPSFTPAQLLSPPLRYPHHQSFNTTSPDPNLSFLNLLQDVVPHIGGDFSWAPLHLPIAPSMEGDYLSHTIQNSSGIDPQSLNMGFEPADSGIEMTMSESQLIEQDDEEHVVDRDWEVIPGV